MPQSLSPRALREHGVARREQALPQQSAARELGHERSPGDELAAAEPHVLVELADPSPDVLHLAS